MRRIAIVALLFAMVASTFCLAADDRLDANELVKRHLASIGDANARAAAKSRGIGGPLMFTITKSGAGQANGKLTFMSMPQKLRIVMQIQSQPYTGEDFISDGNKTDVASTVSGQRSVLGAFVWTRREILRDGVLGGTLSLAWPLLDLNATKPGLKYNGLKKVDGRELHELQYDARKGSGDLKIRFYFDPGTYRHVLTVYDVLVPVAQARSINPSAQSSNGQDTQPVHMYLRESFDNFRTVDGLTLPGSWKLQLNSDVEGAPVMTWDVNARTVQNNNPVDPNAFKVP